MISPNAYSTEIFKRAFQFKKDLIESGYPRNDYLFSPKTNNEKNSIKQKLGIDINKKVILYAPTWRDNSYHKKALINSTYI
ncbi:CDP-glycerol glycerophosphotransferase family protein [Bacillus stercoris]|nr:CDP-glycerol glycerophosphotransferase family protein [Bacillus stercoris]